MAGTSLVKFMNQSNGNGRGTLHWGRADLDGAPFRGVQPPMMTDEEAETRLTQVADAKNRFFDLSVPEDNAAYIEVIDKIANKWAQLIHREHMKVKVKKKHSDGTVEIDVKIKVYIEWIEFFMEDGEPMQSQRPYIGRPNE